MTMVPTSSHWRRLCSTQSRKGSQRTQRGRDEAVASLRSLLSLRLCVNRISRRCSGLARAFTTWLRPAFAFPLVLALFTLLVFWPPAACCLPAADAVPPGLVKEQ